MEKSTLLKYLRSQAAASEIILARDENYEVEYILAHLQRSFPNWVFSLDDVVEEFCAYYRKDKVLIESVDHSNVAFVTALLGMLLLNQCPDLIGLSVQLNVFLSEGEEYDFSEMIAQIPEMQDLAVEERPEYMLLAAKNLATFLNSDIQ